MKPIDYIDRALELVAKRALVLPGYNIFDALQKDLQHVRAVLLGSAMDRAGLHQISIGAIAVKEFDETDAELARALKDVHYVVDQTRRGLKVRLP